MFIGFLSYTNEAVMEEVEEKDLSILDESVMQDLDLKDVEFRFFRRSQDRAVIFGETRRRAKAKETLFKQGPHSKTLRQR